MNQGIQPDAAVLKEVGERLSRRRIESGLTQAELASQAGVGRATIERLEAGHSAQLTSLIRVLRVLGLLDDFIATVPETGPGPMDLLKKRPRMRQRASSRGKSGEVGDTWSWGDDS